MLTVFLFKNNSNTGSDQFQLLAVIAVLVFIMGLVLLFATLRKRRESTTHNFFRIMVFPTISIGVLGFFTTLPVLVVNKLDFNRLVEAYNNKQYQIVEGTVHVISEQPKSGHAKGDLISINGIKFEIDYFLSTHAYTQTIAYGGVLKEGTYVRIYHSDGKILRIDIPREESTKVSKQNS